MHEPCNGDGRRTAAWNKPRSHDEPGTSLVNLVLGLKKTFGMQEAPNEPAMQQPRAKLAAPCEPEHVGSRDPDHCRNQGRHPDSRAKHLLTDDDTCGNDDDVLTDRYAKAARQQQRQHDPWQVLRVFGDELGHDWARLRSSGGIHASRNQRIGALGR